MGSITKEAFGFTPKKEAASLYTLKNASGAYIKVSDFGATLVQIVVPDRNGEWKDVLLGYDSIEGYIQNHGYFGVTVGRNCNRIANARFTLNGQEYQLEANEGKNSLHSGSDGYHTALWETRECSEEETSITFGRISPDGEQGFPGNFNITIKFTLTDANEVILEYTGVTDKDTIANLTNHAYFNLAGEDSGSMLDQELWLDADAFTPVVDAWAIPTGELRPVQGTVMDFRAGKPIGQDLDKEDEQLKYGLGYDHNFVLNHYEPGVVHKAASVYAPTTGIVMDVETDLPGMQFYSGNRLENVPAKGGRMYQKGDGFCLESQYFPDSIHMKDVPSPILKAGTFYETRTVYRFSVR